MAKLLFITYKKFSGILEGGGQVSRKNYDMLAELLGEDNITVYPIHDEQEKKTIAGYLSGIYWFLMNYYFGLNRKRVKEIVRLAQSYDYVFIDRSVFGIIAKKLVSGGYKGKIISFFHNVEKIYFAAKISRRAPWRPLVLKCVDRNDRYSCRYSDKIIVLTSRDAKEIETLYQRKADAIVPVSFKDVYTPSVSQQTLTRPKPYCVFLGSYFPANTEGIRWFVTNVYPYVNIRMAIVGKGMGRLKEEKNMPEDIEIYSDVPDLKPFFEESDFMIFPIFSGSGMKVKTCESLMYGKNIIATSEAFEGYDIDFDKVGGLCDTKEEFIGKIKFYQENPCPRFNAYARQVFLEKYSEEAVSSAYEKILFQ